MNKALDDYNCDEECYRDEITFRANLDENYVQELKDNFGITVLSDWVINDRFSTEFYESQKNTSIWRFVTFDPAEPEAITISPWAHGMKDQWLAQQQQQQQNTSNAPKSIDPVRQTDDSEYAAMFGAPTMQRKRRSAEQRMDVLPTTPEGTKDPIALVAFLESLSYTTLSVSIRYRYYVLDRPYVNVVRNSSILDPKEERKNSLEKAGGQLIYDSQFETDTIWKKKLTARRSLPKILSPGMFKSTRIFVCFNRLRRASPSFSERLQRLDVFGLLIA
ncbi:hypothetical protein Ciccas_001858 [Cichlidogyrus casuarinus]|uniref:BRCT domain-containing protein n=1 Tax=Cichlidogyrus casuarinus TaxID=1844966 RepID=A0ABD2QIU9_9PLAT